MMLTKETGFTIIEICAVLLIIGVLAAIAIPAYTNNLIRSRVAELLNIGAGAKSAITEYRLTHGVMPSSNAQADIPNVITEYISSLQIGANGTITVVGNTTTLGTNEKFSITLIPTYQNGVVSWTCTATGATQYAPSTCR